MKKKLHEYTLKNIRVETLTYKDIYRFGVETSNILQNAEILPVDIQIDQAEFELKSNSKRLPTVFLKQNEADLQLSCTCQAEINILCEHQTFVLQVLLAKPDLKVFFDRNLRIAKLKKSAISYGMADEKDLEQFFEIKYADRQTLVVPLHPELIPVDEKSTAYLKSKLFENTTKNFDIEVRKKKILVFKPNRFLDTYALELFLSTTTKNGGLKNPILPNNPLEEALKYGDIETIRFFTALAKIQKDIEKADLTSLAFILNNPQNLDFYISENENIQVSSLKRIFLEKANISLEIKVNFKEPFYEITSYVSINERQYALKDLRLTYGNFLRISERLILINDKDLLTVIKYLAEKRSIMLIHPNKFELFRKEILDSMPDKVSIAYIFLKEKTQAKPLEWQPDYGMERLVYLTDEKNFVSITPVIKYGKLEVAVNSKKQLIDVDPNGNHFTIDRNQDEELKLTSIIARLHPEFEVQLTEPNFFTLHKQKFLDENWFINAFEILRQNNIKILGFNQLSNNRMSPYKAEVSISLESGVDWFDTKVKLKYGTQQVPLNLLHKALRNKSKFVELDDGTLGIIPEEWLQKFSLYFKAGKLDGAIIRTPKSRFLDISEIYDEEVSSKEAWAEINFLKSTFDNFETIEAVEVPKDLKATLRPYQIHGLNWLACLDSFNFGACLADDMGLGKTIQIIAFLLLQKEKHPKKPNLVVLPTSLLFNWLYEIERFAPTLSVFTHYGNTKLKSKDECTNIDVVITTYGTMLTDLSFLKNIHFNYIILDESQAIKNPESQRHKAARTLKSRNKIILTGTPIENNTYDLYGQLSFVCPGLLGSKSYFRDIYAEPIDKFKDKKREEILRKKINPFILRRTKKQVLHELPIKTEMLIYCEMGNEQRAIYEKHLAELRDYLQHKTDEQVNNMHVLTGLTRLRQICDSPALLPDDEFLGEASSKIDVLLEQIENQITEHKILVFSQFVGMLDLIKKALVERNIKHEYLTGQTKNRAEKVKNFQENQEIRIFLISLKAGGVGLNLTAADYVYLVDPWWNPAVENQAIDRVYRIGQKNKVIAVRLICPNTIEDKMLKLQASKKELANKLVSSETEIFKSFNRKELFDILNN